MRHFETRTGVDAVTDAAARALAQGAGDREEFREQERVRHRRERTQHPIHRVFAVECLEFSVDRCAVAHVDDARDGEPSAAQNVDVELPSATMIAGDRRGRNAEDGSEVARHRDAAGDTAGFWSEGTLAYDDEVVAEESPARCDRGKRKGGLALPRRAEHHVGVSVLGDEAGGMEHVAIMVRQEVCDREVEQVLPHVVEVVAVSADPCTASAPVALTLPAADGVDPLPHHLAALVRADGGVTIELHHKLGDSYSPLDFDAEDLWDRAVPCTAVAVTCVRPSNEDLLAHVCLHFLADRVKLFSRRAVAQLADIAAILDTFADTLDWDTLTRDAISRGYARALALALGTAALVLDAKPRDAAISTLVQHSASTPDIADVVARRVFRDSSWTTLEQLTSRQPSVHHLLPPNPKRWRPGPTDASPPCGMLDGFARWSNASTRLIVRPGEVAAERRFAAELESLIYPHGLPNRARSIWSRALRH